MRLILPFGARRCFFGLSGLAGLAAFALSLATTQATALRGFATGIINDIAAVRVALSQPGSNGPVEGQVNRLKMLKRQMYGRAKFDLLRSRVLHAA